ncbi:MAG: tetratricopeptide repeat protein [Bryobacteraceae bacterium]
MKLKAPPLIVAGGAGDTLSAQTLAAMKKIALGALFFSSMFAAHQHPASAPAEKPVALYPGLGTWRHSIATRQPEAQKFFNQGLVLMYGFNRYEALRSFRKVAELDPNAAMPYWGMAMALGPYINMDIDPAVNIKDACTAVNKGLSLKGASQLERAWLKAAEARCPDFSDPARYVHAMHELAEQYPDDPDAQTLYAEALMIPVRWRWYALDGKPAEGVSEAEHVLESVLRRFPYHPGANHLYIHAVESSPTPERAIPSAQRLMGIVPAAGHMVHMPGHIWLLLGDFNNAAAVNERAADVDRQYFAETGVTGSYYPYYLHNLQFILYARSMQGRVADTKKAAQQISNAAEAMAQSMPDMTEIFVSFATMAQVRVNQWDEVLSLAPPKSKSPISMALWHHARAVAFAGKAQLGEAGRERVQFEKLRKTIDRSIPWSNNKTGDVMDLASAVLEARIQPSPALAVPKWKRAVTIQDELAYDEPPAWYYPVRESLGGSLLMAGDAPAAEAVFREGLRRGPNNGRMLFGLLESLKTQRKADQAAWVEQEFNAAWNGADIQLRLKDL